MDIDRYTLEELKKISNAMIEKKLGNTADSWEEIVSELGIPMSKDNFRKASIGALIERRIQELEVEENSTDKEIEKLNEKIKEYKKERMKWMDAKSTERRYMREEARNEMILEIIENLVKDKNEIHPMDLSAESSVKGENSGILLVSDVHYGLDCDVIGNEYSPEKCVKRFEILGSNVIEYSKLNGVDSLKLFLLGDLINGLIHFTTKLENRVQVIDQVLDISEIVSEFIFKLSECKQFSNIEVYYATGNHERVVPSKKDCLNSEDFGRIIYKYLSDRFKNNEVVSIKENEYTDIINTDIDGHKILAVHGDKDNVGNCVARLSRLTRIVPDYVFLGHYHHVIEETAGLTEVIANGSFCGNSEYSVSGRLISHPMQKFMIFNKGNKLCTYNIRLNV